MEFIKDNIKKCRPELQDSSIRIYILNLKRMSKLLFNSDIPSVYFFSSSGIVIEHLNSIANIATRKNMLTSILVFIKSCGEGIIDEDTLQKYAAYHGSLARKQDDNYADNIQTQKEKDNWITRDEIKKLIDSMDERIVKIKKYSKCDLCLVQDHLILNLYYLLPPLRNDYALTKVIPSLDEIDNLDSNYNYIDIENKKLILCKYKTSKHYGAKIIEIPDTLLTIVKRWCSIKSSFYEKLDNDFLLINIKTTKNITHNNLTHILNRIFKPKKISTTMLRKIYISEKYPVVSTYREMKNDSYIMGHGIDMAKKVYSKVM